MAYNFYIKKKFDKFLTNMFMSGIITQKDGVNYMWHNSFIFFPSRAYAKFYNFLREKIGFDIDEFFYWIGLLQGRNSTRMLKNRFGIKIEDLPSFLDGATIIGMGELKLLKVEGNLDFLLIEGKNAILANHVKAINPKNKTSVDHYLRGILAGGAEIISDHPTVCYEDECMGKKDDRCYYRLENSKSVMFKSILKNIKHFLPYEKKITKYYLNKQPFLKFSFDKKFSQKKGAFFLNKIEGFNIESYLVILIESYIRMFYKSEYEEAFRILFSESFEVLIKDLKLPFTPKSIDSIFYKLNVLGFGLFKTKLLTTNKLIIESVNSSLASESKAIFSSNKIYRDEMSELFIKNVLKYCFEKTVKVKTQKSIADGTHDKSIFDVELK